jgi:uncharacterized sporulation protein YeaH/YhbH (DUF444 family)
MDAAMKASVKLKEKCQLYGYCEVEPTAESLKWLNETALAKEYAPLEDDSFKIAIIKERTDVWPAFKKFFGGDL